MQPPVGERVKERKTDAEGGTVTVGHMGPIFSN